MKNRCLAFVGPLISAALLASVPAAGQTAAASPKPAAATKGAATKGYVLPRTPEGKPDFQGVWSTNAAVPLEKPAAPAGGGRGGGGRGGGAGRGGPVAGTAADVHYDVSQFGLNQRTLAPDTRTSLIIDPPDGRIPPTLPQAQGRRPNRPPANFDGPENRGIAERCIMWDGEGPPVMAPGYNSNLQIVQGDGYVSIIQEMIHNVRSIPTNNRPHPSSAIRLWGGDATGHWEGDTLVVDTTNFNDKRSLFHGAGDNLHLVERFSRSSDSVLTYQFTASDPTTWEKSWTAEIPWAKQEGGIYEYACQEGNYGMPNILSGVRATEKKAAEAAASKK